MRVLFKTYESKMASREKLFRYASEFATQLGRDRLISLSHSEDRDNIIISVWYWGEEEPRGSGSKVISQPASKSAVGVAPASPSGPVTPVQPISALLEEDGSQPGLEHFPRKSEPGAKPNR
jgi:hypothetical protein